MDTMSTMRAARVLSAAHGLNHTFLIFFSPLLLQIGRDLELTLIAISGLVTFAFIAYGVGSLPAGYVADIVGHRKTLIGSILGGSLGLLAAGFAGSYWALALSLAFVGIAGSLYHPAAMAYLSLASRPGEVGRAMAIHGIGANVLMIAAPIITGLMAILGPWRISFWFWAAVGLLLTIVLWAKLPDVRSAPRTTDSDERATRSPWRAVLTGSMGALLVITALQGLMAAGTSAYLAPYAQLIFAQTTTQSGLLLGLFFAGGVPGQYLGGAMADRGSRIRPVILATLGCVAAAFAVPFFAGAFALYTLAFILGLFVFMVQPAMTALVSDATDPRVRGLAFGVFFAMTNGAGGLSPLLAGLLGESGRLVILFPLLGVLLLLSLPFCRRFANQGAPHHRPKGLASA